jgi:outer membrane protein
LCPPGQWVFVGCILTLFASIEDGSCCQSAQHEDNVDGGIVCRPAGYNPIQESQMMSLMKRSGSSGLGGFAKLVLACAMVAAGSVAYAAVPQAVLEQAEALMKAGKAGDAYQLLEPHEVEGAGDEVYDYLLATAALESGRPSKATFIYERILAVKPAFVGVRADMGRAYFALGDYGRAKIEFETVLSFQNLPLDLRGQAEQYVRAAEARAQAKSTVATGYAELGFGRDTNVGSATDITALSLPGAGAYVPAPPVGLKTGDSYASVAMGGEVNHQLTDQWGLYAGGDLRGRAYQTYAEPGNRSVDVRGGANYSGGAWLLRSGLAAGQFSQSGERIRDSVGMTVDWRLALQGGSQATAGVSVSRLMYVPAVQVRQDVVTTTLTGGWLASLGDGSTVLSLSASAGNENAVGGRDDGDKRFWGPRVFAQKTFSDKVGSYVSAGATFSKYTLINPLYLFAREEALYDFALGVTWTIAKGVTVRPQLSYVKNNSNAELFSYDKTDFSLNIRFDF